MDYFGAYITLKDGSLEKACKLLEEIFGCGPTERGRGEPRWRISRKEANWYDESTHKPSVVIYTFDFEAIRIINYLKEQGVAA